MVTQKTLKNVTLDDAANIAQTVTEMDIQYENGVEVLFYILEGIQLGFSASQSIKYSLHMLKIEEEMEEDTCKKTQKKTAPKKSTQKK